METQAATAPVACNLGDTCMESTMATTTTEQTCKSSGSVLDDGEHFDCPEVQKVALHERSCRTNRFPRTLSQDRRMKEYAQFFEAVGERPPRSTSEDIIIVDSADEESQEDEEDESIFQIHELTLPSNPPVLEPSPPPHDILRPCPFKMLSSRSTKQRAICEDFNYRGIGENGLAITRRGVQRGNYATLHRKAWLEVSDLNHRYGKNLRQYYRYWSTLGYPTNHFFDWLDSNGEAEGRPLPDLPECPRSRLEADTVLYISDEEATRSYALSVMSNRTTCRGNILDIDGEPVSTGPDGWIFVLRDSVLYGTRKVTAVSRHSKQRFHHSSFFGGKAVSAAGIIVTDQDGYLTRLYPHSGHYRPGEPDLQRCLCFFYSEGVDLDSFQVDLQQIIHVVRHKDNPSDGSGKGKKKKEKINSLYLKSAWSAAYYLSHKAEWTECGIFDEVEQIHRLRQLGAANEVEIVSAVHCHAGWQEGGSVSVDRSIE